MRGAHATGPDRSYQQRAGVVPDCWRGGFRDAGDPAVGAAASAAGGDGGNCAGGRARRNAAARTDTGAAAARSASGRDPAPGRDASSSPRRYAASTAAGCDAAAAVGRAHIAAGSAATAAKTGSAQACASKTAAAKTGSAQARPSKACAAKTSGTAEAGAFGPTTGTCGCSCAETGAETRAAEVRTASGRQCRRLSWLPAKPRLSHVEGSAAEPSNGRGERHRLRRIGLSQRRQSHSRSPCAIGRGGLRLSPKRRHFIRRRCLSLNPCQLRTML